MLEQDPAGTPGRTRWARTRTDGPERRPSSAGSLGIIGVDAEEQMSQTSSAAASQCNYLLLTPTGAWEMGIFLCLLKWFIARSANFPLLPLADEQRPTRRVKEGTLKMDLAVPLEAATRSHCWFFVQMKANPRAGIFPGVFFSPCETSP